MAETVARLKEKLVPYICSSTYIECSVYFLVSMLLACAGENGKMVGFIRESTSPYRVRTTLIDVNDVMLVEKKMPDEYINEAGNGVTQAFLDWCAPLIGEPLGKLISLR